jgi:hypothetical protein
MQARTSQARHRGSCSPHAASAAGGWRPRRTLEPRGDAALAAGYASPIGEHAPVVPDGGSHSPD